MTKQVIRDIQICWK